MAQASHGWTTWHQSNMLNMVWFRSEGRFAAFQEGPWLQPGAIIPTMASSQQLEALKKQQEKASEWDRWQAQGARQDLPKQSSRHNASEERTSTSLDSRMLFKQLLEPSRSSSNVQEMQHRAREDEVSHRTPGWPVMFGTENQVKIGLCVSLILFLSGAHILFHLRIQVSS